MKWILGLAAGNPWVLAAIAAALIGIGASGGVTVTRWWASSKIAAVEKDLADYQVQAAAVITARLEADAKRTAADQVAVNQISSALEEGKRETEKKFQPALQELDDLRVAAAVWRMRDETAAGDRNTRAPEDAGACQRRADACEDRLRGARGALEEVSAAALEVARSGIDAGRQYEQLTRSIDYIHRVCERAP